MDEIDKAFASYAPKGAPGGDEIDKAFATYKPSAPSVGLKPPASGANPASTMDKIQQWASTPTPEATSITDFATRVAPSSAGKAAVGLPAAAFGLGKSITQGIQKDAEEGTKGGVGNALYYGILHPNTAKAAWEGAKGALGFAGEKAGILPPSQTAPSDAPVDYGKGFPNSLNQWGLRVGHQAITDPVGLGLAVEGGVKAAKGIAATAPLESVARSSGAAANKLTDMTLKQSTTLKPSVRAQNVETAHKLGVLPNAKGVDTLNTVIKNTETQLQDGIAKGDAAKVRGTLDKAIANIESLREKANRSSDPVKNNAIIDAEIERLKGHPVLDENGTVDIGTMQKMKVEQGQEISKKYGQPGYDEFSTSVDKARVRGIKEELESKLDEAFPELAAVNKNLGQYYSLKKSLDRAANRISNREGIGFSAPVKAGSGAVIGSVLGGVPGAAIGSGIGTLIGIVEHPSVAPRLARQLYKLSKGAMAYSDALKTVRVRLKDLVTKKKADAAFEGYQPPSDPEAYDTSVRTPGITSPELERNATPGEGLGYGERELRPGIDTSAAPEIVPAQQALRLKQMQAGFPKGEPVKPDLGPVGGNANRGIYYHGVTDAATRRSRRDAAKEMK